MALTSLQVCMDSPDWLQGTMNEENEMDSSSPSSGEILMCSRPLIERRLRPPHDQPMKCPRCDSAHTKFCYYNNYSLSQPRYFCKTCRRYWTKGGTLRNIPVGGGCRKNKKSSNSKKSSHNMISHVIPGFTSSTHLRLSSPEVQFSHLNNLLGGSHATGFMDSKYNAFLGSNPRPLDFMENKYNREAMILENQMHPVYQASREGTSGNQATISHNFMGNGDHLGIMSNGALNDHFQTFQENEGTTFNSTPYGMSLDRNSNGGAYLDTCQRLMLPYNYQGNEDQGSGIEVKPNTKLLALEWQQDQSCADHVSGKDYNHHSFGYVNAGLESWTGLIDGYGSSATNPLV